MSTLNPRIARLYLTAWLHEEDGVVAFIRDQRIDHRRSEAGSSKHFVNWLDLHAITTTRYGGDRTDWFLFEPRSVRLGVRIYTARSPSTCAVSPISSWFSARNPVVLHWPARSALTVSSIEWT